MGDRGAFAVGVLGTIATPVPGFPEWQFLQLYVGIFPVAEPLIAQALVLALFAAGLGWLRLKARKSPNTAHPA